MKQLLFVSLLALSLWSCKDTSVPATEDAGKTLHTILDNYWEDRLQLFPIEATGFGDNRYNDKMNIAIADSFRDSLMRFYRRNLQEVKAIDTSGLNSGDKISYVLFCYEMEMNMEGLTYPTHLMPVNQFWAFTLSLPQLGSGSGNQPFKTVADYDNWLKRLSVFPAWVDTAIGNMERGIESGWVLPRTLAIKVLPQLKAVIVADTASLFYGPVKSFPEGISAADSERLVTAYKEAVRNVVNPSYQKLYDFFSGTYLNATRTTSGINQLPGGVEYYDYCVRYWTTTKLPSDSIYNIGLQEVANIELEMNKVKKQIGFEGTLPEFFAYMKDNKGLYPFTEPKQVIDSFWNIKKHEEPMLRKLFNNTPKTPFTIRQTEAFREASASAEYNQGSEDGTRPGIFYVPIPDARKFNCVGMTTLFLHEAIPGHHYQISLQQENKELPAFRRFLWYGAYGEGWAHYSETLGGELGLYNDPYQYFGHLSDAIHRAIRLVVDVGLHSKGMTREEAINYMTTHELTSEADATAEIERYMAIPGQALSYKMGQMAIAAERKKYEQQMGSRFDIASFHDEVLKDGCVPLSVLREKLASWSQQ